MRGALLIVDVQNDFTEGGALAVVGGGAVASHLNALLRTPRRGGYDLVVTTQDFHIDPGPHFAAAGDTPDYADSWPRHCLAGTPGAGLDGRLTAGLAAGTVDAAVFKGQHQAAFSGFQGHTMNGQTLLSVLQDAAIGAVDVVGIATDYCCQDTARDCQRLGFVTRMLTGLTAAVMPQQLPSVLASLAGAGVVVDARGVPQILQDARIA